MVTRAPGRTRPVNVNISLDHKSFLEKLARATSWDGDVAAFTGSDDFIPGSPKGSWCVDNPGRFAVEYLWRELLSKYDDGKSSDAKVASAMEKFREGETLCASTNTRLSRLGRFPREYAQGDIEQILFSARGKIKTILGPLSYDAVARGFTFTTGASTRLNRRTSSVPHKYSGTPETTYANLGLATAAIAVVPAWKRSLTSEIGPMHIKVVHGNKVTTVPKNYKTDRVIAVEPDMNMYVQKGFGSLIRRRLKEAGMDLQFQERNQNLARVGSVSGLLATIDLSMASDTVSLELVRFLLPDQWCDALELCRSPSGVLPSGEKVLYRKFSSMGNGYTFELETLIFWGLSLAVCQHMGLETHRTVCFGDDIILPSAAAPLLIDVLSFCGFRTNKDKSFVEGPFRESCGKHFLRGDDVTPVYIKSKVRKLTDLFLFHNRIYRWAERQQWNLYVDQQEIADLLQWVRSHAPSNWRRPRIPDGYGDGAFIGSFDQCLPRVACTYRPGRVGARDGWEGFICQVLVDFAEIADFYENGYGVQTKRKFRPAPNPPMVVGRLLQSLSTLSEERGLITEEIRDVLGGVSLAPQVRLGNLIVQQFAPIRQENLCLSTLWYDGITINLPEPTPKQRLGWSTMV